MRAAAWGALGAYIALSAVAVVVVAFQGAGSGALGAVTFAAFAGVGALIALRQPGNAVGWLLLAVGVVWAATNAGEAWVDARNPGWRGVAGPTSWGVNLWFVPAVVLLPLLFPYGRLPSPRWRIVLWLGIADLVLGTLGAALKPGPLELQQSFAIDNPVGVSGVVSEALRSLDTVVGSAAVLLAGISVIVRFRRSRGVERQQLKWFALVGVLAVACLTVAVLFGSILPTRKYDAIAVVGWLSGLALLGIGVPAAAGIAILRHRLYDVDVVIRRTLVYGALTVALGATYLGLVLLIGSAVGRSGFAVAVSTLAVAALFRPLRARIQGAVDRRFFRSRYDATRTLEAFGAHLRDELDLDALAADLRGIVRETVQPAHVSVWLRSEP